MPVTAEDIAYSFDRMTGKTENHPGALEEARLYIKPNYDFAEALDERTVRIHLLQPWADFLGYAANDLISMVPKHHYEPLDAQALDNPDIYDDIDTGFQNIMGSGPFKPTYLVSKDEWGYDRNPNYWKLDPEGRSLPYLAGLDYFWITDRTAAQAAWEGELLWTTNYQTNGNMSPSTMQEMIVRYGDRFVAYPAACCPSGIAMKVSKPPYDDWKVRRALMLAIDRQAFNELVWSGLGLYGTWCGPPGHPLCLTEDEVLQLPGWRLPKDQDYATARQLLAEAGYADGFSTTFITRNELAAQDEGPVLIENLRNLSIEVEHIAMDRATAFEAQAAGDYDLFSSGAGSGVITPNQYLNQFFLITGRTNPFDWEYCGPCQGEADVDLKALIRQQSQTFDPAERRAILRVIDDITLTKDTQIIQTYTKTYARLFNTEKVAGQMPTQSGYVETKAEQLWLVNP
jgi:peptide/nickel transport system substrate-binding protein